VRTPGARRWLQENSGLSELTSRALLEEETRPRVFSSSDGLIAILRGINFNAGADPDDMVVLRLCVDEERLITVRYRPLMTPRDMRRLLHVGGANAPESKMPQRLPMRSYLRMT